MDNTLVAPAPAPPRLAFVRQSAVPLPRGAADRDKAPSAAAARAAAAFGRLTSSLGDLASLAAGDADGANDRSNSNHSRGGENGCEGDRESTTNSSAATVGGSGSNSNRGNFLSPATDARVGHILQLACAIFRCSVAAVLLEDGSLITARAAPPSRLVKNVLAISDSGQKRASAAAAAAAAAASTVKAPPPAADSSLLAWLSSSAASPFIPETPSKAGEHPRGASDAGGDETDDDDPALEGGDEASSSAAAVAAARTSPPSSSCSTTAASTVVAVADLAADERFAAPAVQRELFDRMSHRRSTGSDATPLPRDPLPKPRFFAAAAVVGAASGRRLGTLADEAPFPLPSSGSNNGEGSVPPRALTPLAGCPAAPAGSCPCACLSPSSPLTAAESALLASLAEMVARGLAADASARARGAALLTMVDSGAPPYLIVEVSAAVSLLPSSRNAAESGGEVEEVWSVVHASPAAAALLPAPAAAAASPPPLSSSSPPPPPPAPPVPLSIPRNTRFWELLVPAVSSAAAAAAVTAAAAYAAAGANPKPFVLRGLCSAAAVAAGKGSESPGCSLLSAAFTPATLEEEQEATYSVDDDGEEEDEEAAGGKGEGEGTERTRRLRPPPPTAPTISPTPRRLFRVDLTVTHAVSAAAAAAEIPSCCYGNGNNAASASASASSQNNASANPFGDQLLLGPLLGQGSYGRVFCGAWRGRRVAVKVARASAVRRRPGDGAPVEAVVAAPLCHRGVVACFAAADSPALVHNGGSSEEAAARATAAVEKEEEDERTSEGERSEGSSLDSRTSGGLFMLDSASSSSCEGRQAKAKLEKETTAMATIATAGSSPSGTSNGNGPASETWFVLELCDGGTLTEALGRGVFLLGAMGTSSAVSGGSGVGGGAPPPTATALARAATAADVAEALAWLHSRGVSHGDLTCSKVLLCSRSSDDDDGDDDDDEGGRDTRALRAKVSDFGLAAHDLAVPCAATAGTSTPSSDASPSSPSPPSVSPLPPHGTVTHMPPERLAGGPPSPQADVFSLGVVLWSMLAAARPWAGLPAPQVVRRVGIEGLSLPPPPDGCAGSPELEAVLRECLKRDPGERPSAEEAARRLREVARRL